MTCHQRQHLGVPNWDLFMQGGGHAVMTRLSSHKAEATSVRSSQASFTLLSSDLENMHVLYTSPKDGNNLTHCHHVVLFD